MPVEPALIGEDGEDQERDPDGGDRDLGNHACQVFGPARSTHWRGQIQLSEDMLIWHLADAAERRRDPMIYDTGNDFRSAVGHLW